MALRSYMIHSRIPAFPTLHYIQDSVHIVGTIEAVHGKIVMKNIEMVAVQGYHYIFHCEFTANQKRPDDIHLSERGIS
jgi:hypothetical protein